jgi:hypothetical protein
MGTNINDNQDVDDQTLLSYREELTTGLLEGSSGYDNALLNLSSGGLLLSIAFITDIAETLSDQSKCLLKVSWGAFIVTILLVIVSFQLSRKALRAQIERVEKVRAGKKKWATLEKQNGWSTGVFWTNILAGVFFFIAVTTTAWFAMTNI